MRRTLVRSDHESSFTEAKMFTRLQEKSSLKVYFRVAKVANDWHTKFLERKKKNNKSCKAVKSSVMDRKVQECDARGDAM